MKSFKIVLTSIDDVKEFVNRVNEFDFDVDLVSGRYVVDAKSIMGIFSLDLALPITARVYTSDAAEFEERLAAFIVK